MNTPDAAKEGAMRKNQLQVLAYPGDKPFFGIDPVKRLQNIDQNRYICKYFQNVLLAMLFQRARLMRPGTPAVRGPAVNHLLMFRSRGEAASRSDFFRRFIIGHFYKSRQISLSPSSHHFLMVLG